jgi:hypothetical protein
VFHVLNASTVFGGILYSRPKLKDAVLLKGRDPRVDGKIILKLILKNCDVLVGLDLSDFSMSPCIHVLGLSCLPSGRLFALSSFDILKNDSHLSSQPLHPYFFQTWQYEPKTVTRMENFFFPLGRTYLSQTQHMLQDSIPNQRNGYSYQFHPNIILPHSFQSTKIKSHEYEETRFFRQEQSKNDT